MITSKLRRLLLEAYYAEKNVPIKALTLGIYIFSLTIGDTPVWGNVRLGQNCSIGSNSADPVSCQ